MLPDRVSKKGNVGGLLGGGGMLAPSQIIVGGGGCPPPPGSPLPTPMSLTFEFQREKSQ